MLLRVRGALSHLSPAGRGRRAQRGGLSKEPGPSPGLRPTSPRRGEVKGSVGAKVHALSVMAGLVLAIHDLNTARS